MFWWGTKTVFHCDQHMNQQAVASSSSDKDALGSCCFCESFSFNAKSAIGIDSNANAISSTNDNDVVNSSQDMCTFAQQTLKITRKNA